MVMSMLSLCGLNRPPPVVEAAEPRIVVAAGLDSKGSQGPVMPILVSQYLWAYLFDPC
jgi:hypothetical protein